MYPTPPTEGACAHRRQLEQASMPSPGQAPAPSAHPGGPLHQPVVWLAPAPTVGPPGPVVAVCVVLCLCSGLSILFALVLAAGGAVGAAVSDIPVAGIYGHRIALIGIGGAVLLFILAALDIVLGICLWRGHRWARTTTVVGAALSVLASLPVPVPGFVIVDLVVAALLVALLVVPPRSRRFFARCALVRPA